MNHYATIADKETLGLVVLAQTALGYTQQRLADALDTSLRTVQRWSSRDSHPMAGHIRTLAILVHPHDANLAGKLAARIDDTPESLGLVARPPPPTERAVTLTREVSTALAESVVAAAAEAMDASPRVARPVVVAAMQRAMTCSECARSTHATSVVRIRHVVVVRVAVVEVDVPRVAGSAGIQLSASLFGAAARAACAPGSAPLQRAGAPVAPRDERRCLLWLRASARSAAPRSRHGKTPKSQRVEKSGYPSSTHATSVVRKRHVDVVRGAVVEEDAPRAARSAGIRCRRPKEPRDSSGAME